MSSSANCGQGGDSGLNDRVGDAWLSNHRRQEPPGLGQRQRPAGVGEQAAELGTAQLDGGLTHQSLGAGDVKQECRTGQPGRVPFRLSQSALGMKMKRVLIQAMKRADHRFDRPIHCLTPARASSISTLVRPGPALAAGPACADHARLPLVRGSRRKHRAPSGSLSGPFESSRNHRA